MMERIALFLIGLYSLGSARWGSNFSEYHLSLPSLDFPVFISEILLAVCLLLWAVQYERQKMVWTKGHKLFVIYWAFVVVKALGEYGAWGPLAFRNAALFYYPAFAFLGYCFYKREYFSPWSIYAALALCIVLSIRLFDTGYFVYTLFALAVVLLFHVRPVVLRAVLAVILIGSANYAGMFVGSRTNLMGTLAALLFLIVVFVRYFLKGGSRVKTAVGAAVVLAVLAGVVHFADRNGVRSLLKVRNLYQIYLDDNAYIAQLKQHYQPRPLTVALYNDNAALKIQRTPAAPAPQQQMVSPPASVPVAAPAPQRQTSSASTEPTGPVAAQQIYRSLADAQGNAVFRLLIWRDMFEELKEHPLRGVGFGKPQRSPSLEIMNWGFGDWNRDGWITPHNVYLHMIYRLGIVGALVIVVLFGVVFYLTKNFILLRSKDGILLVSILIYWLMACNSLVILELPHYAIPFWTLMGLTLAYCNEQRKNKALRNT
ncbi:MAG: O-antigen ligase family protein [Candidatus Omnitrophota bacterium]|nr:O-antigen ligase family protein [Candidatus Omnitrophota bacterium]